VAHHHAGRPFETLDEKPALVIDRQAERPRDPPHSALAQPTFCATEQGGEYVGFIDGIEEAKMTGYRIMPLYMPSVDLGADPADRPRSPARYPVGDLYITEERVSPSIEMLQPLGRQGLHPAWIAGENLSGHTDELP